MKKGIHPESYRLVAFRDMSNGHTFLTKSTAASRETVTLEDGKEYPRRCNVPADEAAGIQDRNDVRCRGRIEERDGRADARAALLDAGKERKDRAGANGQ